MLCAAPKKNSCGDEYLLLCIVRYGKSVYLCSRIKISMGITNKTTKLILLFSGLCCALGSFAQEASEGKVEWGAELTSDLQATHAGKFNYVNLLRLNAGIEITSQLKFDVATLSTCMTAKESIGKDLQTFSNIDAGNIPLALSKCGLTWNVNSKNTLSVGVRNMNEDYFCSDVTSLFTNSSCGIYPTIAANFPISNYPLASVGVHYKYECQLGSDENNDVLAVQASLYNGNGYKDFTGRDNVFRMCPKSDGVFGLVEAQYQHKGSQYFVGNAFYSNDGMSYAPWAYAEQSVTDNLRLIAGYSHAFGSSSACSDFAGIGGMYSWKQCDFGIFSDYARFEEGDEFATEFTCKAQLTQHLYLQPTFHLAFTGDDTTVAGMLRLGLAF